MLEVSNIVVIDLECAKSADDCRYCGLENVEPLHLAGCCRGVAYAGDRFTPLGWDNTAALGLCIGCYWSYTDSRIHWFDTPSLETTMRHLVEMQPLIVSFNGIGFDGPLMLEVLTADLLDHEPRWKDFPHGLAQAWADMWARSYDLLAEIWTLDPVNKYRRGLNSLDAISQASGLGAKLSHGAQAPRDWRDGRYADVLNYCQDDVYKTKELFEMVCRGKPLIRGNGEPVYLPKPTLFHEVV